MSLILSILVFVLSLPRSLASKSVVYTTGLSVASYLAWSVAVSRPSATNALASFQRRVLWNEISSVLPIDVHLHLLIRLLQVALPLHAALP